MSGLTKNRSSRAECPGMIGQGRRKKLTCSAREHIGN